MHSAGALLSQLRLQVFVTVVLVLLTFMLVMSFASVFSGGGLTAELEPHILLTLQLTVFNVRAMAVGRWAWGVAHTGLHNIGTGFLPRSSSW